MSIDKILYLGDDEDGFTAADDRIVFLGSLSAGVRPIGMGDVRNAFKVSQRQTPSPNFSVDVLSGWCIVVGTDEQNQGHYAVFNGATVNLPNATGAPGTFPRIDSIVLQVNDSEHTARTPIDTVELKWLYGTPTSGATIANRNGAAALGPSSYLLADVLVQTSSSSITDAMITERRVASGPMLHGENGKAYRLGVNVSGYLGLEQLT